MSVRRPALFASAFAPHVGGVEELTRQLALEQQRRGLVPLVATMRWPKTLSHSEVIGGVPVLRYVFRVPEPSPRFLAGWLAFSTATRRQMLHDLREQGVDLVHVQCVSNNAGYALTAARTLDVPLVVSMQGELTMDATAIYQRSAQQRRAWRHLLDAADVVTGCSQAVLDDARAAYQGSWVDRASVIPNGVRVADFSTAAKFRNERPYVLGIGRMVTQKGFDVLLRAFALCAHSVDSDGFGLDLILAGDGPERRRLEDLARDLGISQRTRFLGAVDRAMAAELFAGASVFVLPSRLEPQGIVILEAMAAGTPVVASDVGGVSEIVGNHTNGLLVPAGDAEAIAEGIAALTNRSELAARLTGAGAITAGQMGWAVITQRYLDVYESI